MINKITTNPTFKFVLLFIVLFLPFYYFNIIFFGLTTPEGHYSAFLANNLNYIQTLRWILLNSSASILNCLGFTAITNNYQMLVAGHGAIQVVYACLGLGVISFFAAFVIAYPKPLKPKLIFLITGILLIEVLNIIRFMLLALFWNPHTAKIIDHHTIFNIIIYIIVAVSLYFWIKTPQNVNKKNAAN